ncbi:MAG: Hsp70 family protein [Proteobacteria bacterium]|nr:Hsp70 family protein [Pseudomonadota bacterium]
MNNINSGSRARYAIGIDLGTTNCALAYVDLSAHGSPTQVLEIPQWESDGSVVRAPTLPSYYYLPPKSEWRRGQLALPQHAEGSLPDFVVGKFARWQSSQVPGRVIHQAKSWLCHDGVDREERILPWHVGDLVGDERRSPVEVSAAYLQHLREAWNLLVAKDAASARFEEQDIVITVPASFDEAAQGLTLAAAMQAGYPAERVRLLEEPQAAFYHWLNGRHDLPKAEAFNVLIVDIGGGTSDFSLFRVDPRPQGQPDITRVAVSEHLLLGGDNIDLSLAHALEHKLVGDGNRLSSREWAQLAFGTRQLKESALSADAAATNSDEELDAELFVSIAGEGSSLMATARTASLRRAEIRDLVVSGFFPLAAATDVPRRQRQGLTQLGLPYAQDGAITRHIAQFVANHQIDAVLFNGGTLRPAILRRTLLEQITEWQNGSEPVVLASADMDLAVALGAAHYAALRHQPEALIKGGYARSVYVEVDVADKDKGGDVTGPNLMCIVPKGYDGVTPLKLDSLDLKLRADSPVRFQLFTSTTRADDHLGDIVVAGVASRDSFHPLPPLHTRIDLAGKKDDKLISVQLETSVAETGLLCLYLVHQFDQTNVKRWQLDFNVRGASARSQTATPAASAKLATSRFPANKIAIAVDKLDTLYGKKRRDEQLGAPKNLVKDLEDTLGAPREDWDTSLLRGLWPHLATGMTRRGRSLNHETQWLYLAGYSLRPGYGCELDEWRTQELWRCFQQGLSFPKEKQAEEQWWIMWRRVAGGLLREQQEQLFERIFPALRKDDASPELYLLAGSLERVDMMQKIRLGQHLTQQLAAGRQKFVNQRMWALARIASRVPLYGGPHTIARPELVVGWFDELKKINRGDAAFSKLSLFLTQAGRMIGDREYDLSDAARGQFLAKLGETGASAEQMRLVREFVPVDTEAKMLLFGESLPAGLVLS